MKLVANCNNRFDDIAFYYFSFNLSITLIHIHLHRFGKEQGISGVAVLAESHLSVHTWPERNYIAFDMFMCGDTDPIAASNYLIATLKPKKKKVLIIKRGVTNFDR